MKLSEIFKDIDIQEIDADLDIQGLCIDSRKAKAGDMFFCLKGLEADGHNFAKMAADKGAVCIVISDDVEEQDGVVYVKVNDTNDELNRVCDLFYGSPSHKMDVFGVTGTNGKTTTTSIIRDVYEAVKPCGYMGTIAVRYGNYSRVPSLTTPDALEIHQNLKEMVDHGMEAVAMEVSSHGLAMRRVDSVDFDVAIFTNLTYDHLDYHKTMENYFDAKKILFTNLKDDGIAVLNADDMSFDVLRREAKGKVVSYGVENQADYSAEKIDLRADGTTFDLCYGGERYAVKTNLVALYNIYNLLGAIAGMHEMGMDFSVMIPRLENIAQVDGRMEIIREGQNFNLIVDYAHTPDGFDKVFEYAKEIAGDKAIYSVFGCAGKRDKVKRKVLGEIANKYCKTVYVTTEDPRDESPAEIAEMILGGIDEGRGVYIEDRYEAIKAAIEGAAEGDVVLVLGKGDEPYMYYEDGRHPWMGDQEAAKEIVKAL